MKIFILALAIICFTSSGFADVRGEAYVKKHPGLSERMKAAISTKWICKGMSEAQVIASWGKPDKEFAPRCVHLAGSKGLIYRSGEYRKDKSGRNTRVEYVFWISFKKGKVIRVYKHAYITESQDKRGS